MQPQFSPSSHIHALNKVQFEKKTILPLAHYTQLFQACSDRKLFPHFNDKIVNYSTQDNYFSLKLKRNVYHQPSNFLFSFNEKWLSEIFILWIHFQNCGEFFSCQYMLETAVVWHWKLEQLSFALNFIRANKTNSFYKMNQGRNLILLWIFDTPN